MRNKNSLKLHEAIVVALVDKKVFDSRTGTFDAIADYIEERNLYPNRKGNVVLSKQVMLRSTKSKKQYSYLFEEVDINTIRLRNL